ncbi:MAG TPA: SBBP repeat-containing protein [Chloroflexia bacterium]
MLIGPFSNISSGAAVSQAFAQSQNVAPQQENSATSQAPGAEQQGQRGQQGRPGEPDSNSTRPDPRLQDYLQLPVHFEPNVGQTDASVSYMARTSGAMLFFSPSEIVLALKSSGKGQAQNRNADKSGSSAADSANAASDATPGGKMVRLSFVGANTSTSTSASADSGLQIEASDPLAGKVNYFIGNDPAKWHSDISTYGSITYSNLYPGISLRYDGSGGQLKGTYTVAPGADPSQLRWRFDGVEHPAVDGKGNLHARVHDIAGMESIQGSAAITVTEETPVAWQEIDGQTVPVSIQYDVASDGSIGFSLGSYDKSAPLILDPTLTYSTYIGGNNWDEARAVAADRDGNAYITGYTDSSDFRLSYAARQWSGSQDAFVVKIKTLGSGDSSLMYSTYLGSPGGPGSNGEDRGEGIAIDGYGNAYVTGYTTGSDTFADFPIVGNAAQPTFGKGIRDAYLTKLNPYGTSLLYSTYLGGNGLDNGWDISVHSSGQAFITGNTASSNLRMVNAYKTAYGGGTYDAYLIKIDTNAPSGIDSLTYSTYLGGSGEDVGQGVANNNSGDAYLTGYTTSVTGFPLKDAARTSLGGSQDAFITRINTTVAGLNSLVYSTYWGGSGYESGSGGIVVPADGYIYVAGETASTDLVTSTNAYRRTRSGAFDAYLTKFSDPMTSRATPQYSTYLGGSSFQSAFGLAVDSLGYAYLTGETASTNFPLANPYLSTNSGGMDAFVSVLNTWGSGVSSLIFSTYLGGSAGDAGAGIATQGDGNIYVAGYTRSTDLPIRNGYQTSYTVSIINPNAPEAFFAKLHFETPQNVPKTSELRCGGSPSQIPTTLEAGDGVNTATGNYCYSSLELSIPGRGVPINFAVAYSSDMAAQAGPLGYGWTHSYNMYVQRDSANNYLVYEENGNVVTFDSFFQSDWRVLATLSYNSTTLEYTFTRMHGQVRYIFKEVGSGGTKAIKLVRILDRNNYVTTLTYDTKVRLSRVTEPNGRYLEFTYVVSTNSITSQLVDYVRESLPATTNGFPHTNRTVDFSYVSNELRGLLDVGGHTTDFDYGTTGDHFLRGVTETRNGARTRVLTNTYDPTSKRVVQQSYPAGRSTSFGYTVGAGSESVSTNITDALGLVTVHSYFYNKIGQVVDHAGTGSQEGKWDYIYNLGETWVSEIIDPLGHRSRFTWGGWGTLRSATDALGHTTGYNYTTLNDVDIVTNPDGFAVDHNYDAAGNLTMVTRRHAETNQLLTVEYIRNPTRPDEIDSIKDARTNSWTFTYDGYGYPDLAKNPAPFQGEVTNFDYDGVGRLRKVTDPKKNPSTQYQYNAYNQVTKVIDPLLKETIFGYDPIGNLTSVRDQNFHTTTYGYNLNNELERVTQHDGSYSFTTYDPLGRVKTHKEGLRNTPVYQSENPNKQPTVYDYYDIERRVEVFDPLNRRTEYHHNAAGLLTLVKDPDSRTTVFHYFDNDWLQNINYSDANTPDVTFTYYGRGLRKTMVDGTGTTTFGYDSLDRLTLMNRGNEKLDNTGGLARTLDYGYDPAGNLETITYPERPGATTSLTVVRQFDTANRMKTLTASFPGITGQNVSTFTYDPNGNLKDIDYTNTDTDVDTHAEILYDARDQVDVITHTHKMLPQLIFLADYERDNKGLVITSTEYLDGGNVKHTYAYNALDHLKEDRFTGLTATEATTSTWDYDASGQIWQSRVTPNNGQDPVVTTRLYDLAGQLYDFTEAKETAGGVQTTKHYTFVHDRMGNRTSRTSRVEDVLFPQTIQTSYTPNQANQLRTYDNTTDYRYDGDGLRQHKCGSGSGGTCYDHFTWDIASSGVPLLLQDSHAQYIYGPGGMLLATWNDQVSDPMSSQQAMEGAAAQETTSSSPLGNLYYYLLDQQGNVRGLLQDGGGTLTKYYYDAYGNQTEEGGGILPYNRFGYAGQYRDEESELWHMRARNYDAVAQQFTSRDPVAGSGQPYVYAGGNPVNFSDPMGTTAWPSSFMQSNPIPGGDDELPGGAKGKIPGGGGAGQPPTDMQGANAAGAGSRWNFQIPHPRHFIKNVRLNTLRRGTNTVIEPGVDVAADVAAINAGTAVRSGSDFVINGRTYRMHSNKGRLIPISGPGFHQLSRDAYRALGVYNTFGNSPLTNEILGQMKVSSAGQEAALRAWEIGGNR